MEINKWRIIHLAAAEAVDAWRLVPRILVTGYAYMLFYVVYWYMQLKPYIMESCMKVLGSEAAQRVTECIIQEPSTQHTALVTAVVGISAGVFGFYANTGRRWGEGVYTWPIKPGDAPPPQYIPVNNPYPSYPAMPAPYSPYNTYDPYNPYNNPYGRPTSAPEESAKPPAGDDI